VSSLLSLPISLPPAANLAAAFVAANTFETTVSSIEVTHLVKGTYYELAITVFCTLSTSSATGSRTPFLFVQDANGRIIWQIPGASEQAANTNGSYTWAIDVSALAVSGNNRNVMPLPPLPLLPTYTIGIFVDSGQTGDTLGSLSMQTLFVPSGPYGPDDDTTTPVATPVIV